MNIKKNVALAASLVSLFALSDILLQWRRNNNVAEVVLASKAAHTTTIQAKKTYEDSLKPSEYEKDAREIASFMQLNGFPSYSILRAVRRAVALSNTDRQKSLAPNPERWRQKPTVPASRQKEAVDLLRQGADQAREVAEIYNAPDPESAVKFLGMADGSIAAIQALQQAYLAKYQSILLANEGRTASDTQRSVIYKDFLDDLMRSVPEVDAYDYIYHYDNMPFGSAYFGRLREALRINNLPNSEAVAILAKALSAELDVLSAPTSNDRASIPYARNMLVLRAYQTTMDTATFLAVAKNIDPVVTLWSEMQESRTDALGVDAIVRRESLFAFYETIGEFEAGDANMKREIAKATYEALYKTSGIDTLDKFDKTRVAQRLRMFF